MEVVNMLENHRLFGNIITWVTVIFFIFWLYLYFKKMDDKRIDRVAQIILIAIVVAIFYTASIGGNLVWEHGVGVK